MWLLTQSLFYSGLRKDDLGVSARPAAPPPAKLQLPTREELLTTSNAVAGLYTEQKDGKVTQESRTEASKDLVQLSQSSALSKSEVSQVKAIQAKIDSGQPLTVADVKQIKQIVDGLQEQLQPPSAAGSKKHFEQGYALYEKGKLPEAETEFRKGLAVLPPDDQKHRGTLLLNLGRTLEGQGRKDEAIDAFKQALATGTLTPERTQIAHEYLQKMGAEAPAAAASPAAPPAAPGDAGKVFYEQGRKELANGNNLRAEAQFRQGLAALPADDTKHRSLMQASLGMALQQQGRPAEARQAYQAALAGHLKPEEAAEVQQHLKELPAPPPPSEPGSRAHFDKAQELHDKKMPLEAEAEFRKGLAQLPADDQKHRGTLLLNLGRTLEEQGRKKEAIEAFQQSLATGTLDEERANIAREYLKKLGA